jgi:hypothetical protein
MFKMSRPVMYLLLGTIVVALYLLATPPTSPTKKKTTPRPRVSIQASSVDYQPVDYTAHFDKPLLVSRDAFNPLVARKSNALAQALAAAGNIPAEFTGGDPNWSCTGSAQVDGLLQVLVENKSTGDGVFLKQGDHWKQAVVAQVMEDGVVLVGPSGEPKTIHVKQDTTPEELDLNGSTEPVQPQLNGPIGSGGGQSNGQNNTSSPLPAAATPAIITSDDNSNDG